MTPHALDTPKPDAARTPAPPYFPVARHKLIVMSLATLSTCQLYWFFAQVRTDARSRYTMWNVVAIVVGISLTIAGVIALHEVDLLFQQLESQL